MNKKALLYGLFYSLVVIVFKLYIVLSDNMFSKFGFYYSIITAVFLIIPFFFLAIYHVREKDHGGYIGAKEGMRIGLTVLAIGLIITSVYNYVEFNWKADEFIKYYNSSEYLEILKVQQVKNPDKIKVDDFPRIINEQIATLSAFRATTGKIIPLLFIGLSGAFAASIIMKRDQKLVN
ncbi:DUF4199 domain-containing protein [Aurantibacillus circumpalustris]|uniref:DUF4199 domain-containing protein n=1 Tax=Aurantibacillus circumpalustris TaxID=3036359 RepID=UPI00295AB4F7|nr:DUF4199 domain-containing protein [Aurantibacillus circumpalustris]